MQNQLDQMSQVKDTMAKYADQMGGNFADAMKGMSEMHDKLQKNSLESERQLLLKVMQDIEFADGQADITEDEFQAFVEHVPKHRRQNFLNKDFKKISGGAETIDYKKLQAVIDECLKEEALP